MGWGSSEFPDCRGFSVDELSRIRFDEIHFDELFSEMTEKINAKMQVIKRNMNDRVKQMVTDFKGNPKEKVK